MSLWELIGRNALRNSVRFALTALSVAAVITGLALVRSISDVWDHAVQASSESYLIVRSALPRQTDLPLEALAKIAALDKDMVKITPRWHLDLAAHDARPRPVTAEVLPTEALAAHPAVLALPEAQRERFLADPGGALVSRELAAELGWTLDTPLVAGSRGWRGLTVAALFTASARRERIVLLHAEASQTTLASCHELVVQVSHPALAAMIATKIDRTFAESRVPTITQSEHQLMLRAAAGLTSLFRIVDVVSVGLLALLALVCGGTIVLTTHERTTEYAVLRALGFSPLHVGLAVSGEALLVALTGAIVSGITGTSAASAVEGWAQKAALGNALPGAFTVSAGTHFVGAFSAVVLVVLASVLPAIRAANVPVAEELRRQG